MASAASRFHATTAQSDWIAGIFSSALHEGLHPGAFVELASRAFTSTTLRAFVLADSRDLLWSITGELSRDYGIAAHPVDLDRSDALAIATGEVGLPDLIVTSQFHAAEARDTAKRLDRRVCVVTMCRDLYASVRALLHDREVYFVVADPRFAARLHATFAPHRRHDRLVVLVLGRDDLRAIPRDAPLYSTQLARSLDPSVPSPSLGLAETRVFSQGSAMELLSVVVRANLAASSGSGQQGLAAAPRSPRRLAPE